MVIVGFEPWAILRKSDELPIDITNNRSGLQIIGQVIPKHVREALKKVREALKSVWEGYKVLGFELSLYPIFKFGLNWVKIVIACINFQLVLHQ